MRGVQGCCCTVQGLLGQAAVQLPASSQLDPTSRPCWLTALLPAAARCCCWSCAWYPRALAASALLPRLCMRRCQPADVFGDVLPRLGTGAQQESEKVRQCWCCCCVQSACNACMCACSSTCSQQQHMLTRARACMRSSCCQRTPPLQPARLHAPARTLQPSSADADLAGAMRNSLMTWVQCWSSEGADLEQLNKGERLRHRASCCSMRTHCLCSVVALCLWWGAPALHAERARTHACTHCCCACPRPLRMLSSIARDHHTPPPPGACSAGSRRVCLRCIRPAPRRRQAGARGPRGQPDGPAGRARVDPGAARQVQGPEQAAGVCGRPAGAREWRCWGARAAVRAAPGTRAACACIDAHRGCKACMPCTAQCMMLTASHQHARRTLYAARSAKQLHARCAVLRAAPAPGRV